MDTILDMLFRGIEQLLGRFDGPLHFRLLMMPTMVTILAIRAYRKDVREGNPIYLGAFIKDPAERRRLLRSGLKDFGRVFVFACVLDITYQILVLKTFYPVQMLIVAVVCAIVPYFLIRGPVTRIAHLLFSKKTGKSKASHAAKAADDKNQEPTDD